MRSEVLELARLVITGGTTMPPHRPCRVAGAVVIHCLDGAIRLRVPGQESTVRAGELVHLDRGVEHEISALEDATVLLTITFQPTAAGKSVDRGISRAACRPRDDGSRRIAA